ncbi:MAG: hypothetical protein JXQ76_00295 [Campylobacterales bacterium]|nr:hypothetical protein [Campylobacterales bacterium]
MSSTREIAIMDLADTDNGKITVSIIDKPYGEKSQSVASIGIALQASADEPDWKVHLPKANIDGIIEALQKAKEQL